MQLKEWIKKQIIEGQHSTMESVYEYMSDLLGIGKSSIKQWVAGQRRVGAEHVLNVERITNGKVTRHHLRKDLYPADD